MLSMSLFRSSSVDSLNLPNDCKRSHVSVLIFSDFLPSAIVCNPVSIISYTLYLLYYIYIVHIVYSVHKLYIYLSVPRDVMSNMTSLTEKALGNLDEVQLELDSSTEYFKPRAGPTYVLEIDIDKHQIIITESDRFKDSAGKPLKQYQFIIKHVNNGIEQKWNVTSKNLVRQLMTEIRKGFKVIKIQRTGEDKNTTYQIEGVQKLGPNVAIEYQ
jgi:hypothetical protein